MIRTGKGLGLSLLALPAAVALLALAPASASAAECDNPAQGAKGSVWWPDASTGGISEGELYGFFSLPRFDAFDTYGAPEIDGTAYSNPDNSACKRKGRTFKFPSDEVIADVMVKPELYVAKKRAMGRQLVTIRNIGNSPVTIDFGWDGDLGSDSDTRIASTSSGNNLAEPNDRWAATCEDSDGDGCGDVADEADRDTEIAHNWEKKGKRRESADAIDATTGNTDFDVTFEDVTLRPGKTKVFAQVVHLTKSIKQARKAAKATDRAPRFVYGGLTKSQRRKLQNW